MSKKENIKQEDTAHDQTNDTSIDLDDKLSDKELSQVDGGWTLEVRVNRAIEKGDGGIIEKGAIT